jgi:hypothetical protein
MKTLLNSIKLIVIPLIVYDLILFVLAILGKHEWNGVLRVSILIIIMVIIDMSAERVRVRKIISSEGGMRNRYSTFIENIAISLPNCKVYKEDGDSITLTWKSKAGGINYLGIIEVYGGPTIKWHETAYYGQSEQTWNLETGFDQYSKSIEIVVFIQKEVIGKEVFYKKSIEQIEAISSEGPKD